MLILIIEGTLEIHCVNIHNADCAQYYGIIHETNEC